MALNPAFVSHSSRPLPLAFGYVLGGGDQVLSIVSPPSAIIPNGVQQELSALGEGEWDDYVFALPQAEGHFFNGLLGDAAGSFHAKQQFLHFHRGQYTIRGAGNQLVSTGGDQQYDTWFANFPSVTPPQSYSGIAYAIFGMAMSLTFKFGVGTPFPLAPSGVWRSLRCRIFDASGNVTGYGFTTNPAWHFVEAILRRKIKPQQPGLAGLTDAEKACFNWESIAATAARNDFVLPNGNPRFMGSYVFAADTTLTNVLETILRVSRSYQRVQNGQIYLIGDDPRPSTFLMGANHVVPGTVKLNKKDVAKAPNVFVPRYRDINIPAVSQVLTAVHQQIGIGSGVINSCLFTLNSLSPFVLGDVITYGGGENGAFAGAYTVVTPLTYDNNDAHFVDAPNQVRAVATEIPAGSSSGGYLGVNDARFSERAPANIVHRSHQRLVPMQAPGLGVQPNITRVEYDCGNCTFDQTNRLMKFERDRTLGTDIGAGWKAPVVGTLTARLEAVDANNAALIDRQLRDVITLDDWVSPEFAGDYEILSRSITPASDGGDGQIVLQLMQYNRDAYTDVSDDPGQSYAIVPDGNMPLGTFPLTTPAWVLEATPNGTLDPITGLLTVKVPDLSIQWVGDVAPTLYPGAQWTGLTAGQPYVLYLDDASEAGTGVIYSVQAGTLPLASMPPNRVVVLYGVFNPNNYVDIDLETGAAAFFTGSGYDQTSFNLPATASANAENLMAWASPRDADTINAHLHYIQICTTDGTRKLQLVYNDGAGTTWRGHLNFAALSWNDAASVTQSASGLMQFTELTLAGGEEVCFGVGTMASGSLVAFPAGYSIAQSILLAFPSSAADSGHPAHGFRAYVDAAGRAHHDYSDGSGNNWSGPATVLLFAWKNNKGTVVRDGGWVKIPLSTGRTFAVAGFSILDARAGSAPPNFPSDNLTHITSGGKLPLPSNLSATTLQVIPGPNSFQITGNDAHGIHECLIDAALNVKTSFADGSGNTWFGSSAAFAMIVDAPAL